MASNTDLSPMKASNHGASKSPSLRFRLSKDWIRYRGPFGGEGWQNVETGDVRYVEEPPGEVATDEQVQTTLPGEGYDLPVDLSAPKWVNEVGTVGEIIQDTLMGPESQGNPRIRITEMWSDGDYDESVDGYIEATADWITEHGDSRDAARFQEALQQYDSVSPWGEVDADVPDHLNPENAEEITLLSETDANAGISAHSMMVAEMDSGDRVFLTNVNPHVPGDLDAQGGRDAIAAEQAASFLEELDVAVPEHEYVEGEYLAVAEADGRAIGDTMGRVRVSKGEFASFAAKQLLVGNTDGHSENVFYGYNGLEPIDLDYAGSDFQKEPEEVAWALGKLFDTAAEAGVYPPYSDEAKQNFIEDVQAELDGWVQGESADDALNAVDNWQFEDVFRHNVELARDGKLIDDNQDIVSGL